MTRRYAGLLLAFSLAAPAVGGAQVPSLPSPPRLPTICGTPLGGGPFAFVAVNQTCVNLTSLIGPLNPITGLFQLNVTNLVVGAGRINSLTATFKPDPFISFGANTSNLEPGPTSYSFFFGTPIEPGFYSRATSTAAVSVTSGVAGSATVAQDGGNEFVNAWGSNGVMLTSLGVDIGTGTCTAGAASNTCRYPPPTGGPQENTFAPTFFDNLEVELNYTQTDAGSQVGWTGRVDLFDAQQTHVPEPGTIALVLTGLLAIGGGGMVRRRRTG